MKIQCTKLMNEENQTFCIQAYKLKMENISRTDHVFFFKWWFQNYSVLNLYRTDLNVPRNFPLHIYSSFADGLNSASS